MIERRHDLELFERSLRNATEQHTGDALDAALAELGLARRARRSIRVPRCRRLFELQGEAGATSSALDHVVAFALGRELDGATSRRAAGARAAGAPPGMLDDDRIAVARPRPPRSRPSTLVVAAAGDEHVAAVVDTPALDVAAGARRRSRGSASSRSPARSTSTTPQPVDWTAAVALAPARASRTSSSGVADDARAGARARARARPVRPADRAVPGRPPPPGRHARRDRDRRRRPRRRVARRLAGDRGDGQGDSPGAAPAPRPATASRCSPASASPPSTTCTATSGASSSSTSSSARTRPSPSTSARTCSRPASCPRCCRCRPVLAWRSRDSRAQNAKTMAGQEVCRACGRGWRGTPARRTTGLGGDRGVEQRRRSRP